MVCRIRTYTDCGRTTAPAYVKHHPRPRGTPAKMPLLQILHERRWHPWCLQTHPYAMIVSFCHCRVDSKSGRIRRVKRYWETVADNLTRAGWRCGCTSSTDHEGRQFWVVAAERGDAGRFIVHADDKLSAFMELESVTREAA
jgi:hypothetical protein